MDIPAHLLVHEVTVEPYAGSGPFGESYGAPVPLACFRDAARRLVRDTTGAQVVSEVTLIAAPGQAEAFPPDSRVTWGNPDAPHVTTVIVAHDHDDGGMGAPQHTEIVCA